MHLCKKLKKSFRKQNLYIFWQIAIISNILKELMWKILRNLKAVKTFSLGRSYQINEIPKDIKKFYTAEI